MTEETTDSSGAIPATLTDYDQWICWREQERDGKPTKVPVDPTSGEFASTTNCDTWAALETARSALDRPDVDGLGFVFSDDDPIVGVDLDDCRDPETGEAEPRAEEIIDRLDSYTEVSPSGTGYHVLIEGTLPPGGNRSGDVEMYETSRFFTVTGDHVDGTPTDIRDRSEALTAVHTEYVRDDATAHRGNDVGQSTADVESTLADDEILERAQAAANGRKFQRLWTGDTSGYESHSEADMALCCLLAFWTGGDQRQIDRLFRRSGLMREKWDEVHYSDGSTYGERTVKRAVRRTSEFYEPTGGDDGAADTRAGDGVAGARSGAGAAQPRSSEDTAGAAAGGGAERGEAAVTALASRVAATETTVDHLERRLEALEAELAALRDDRQEGQPTTAERDDQSARRERGVVGRLWRGVAWLFE